MLSFGATGIYKFAFSTSSSEVVPIVCIYEALVYFFVHFFLTSEVFLDKITV